MPDGFSQMYSENAFCLCPKIIEFCKQPRGFIEAGAPGTVVHLVLASEEPAEEFFVAVGQGVSEHLAQQSRSSLVILLVDDALALRGDGVGVADARADHQRDGTVVAPALGECYQTASRLVELACLGQSPCPFAVTSLFNASAMNNDLYGSLSPDQEMQ